MLHSALSLTVGILLLAGCERGTSEPTAAAGQSTLPSPSLTAAPPEAQVQPRGEPPAGMIIERQYQIEFNPEYVTPETDASAGQPVTPAAESAPSAR